MKILFHNSNVNNKFTGGVKGGQAEELVGVGFVERKENVKVIGQRGGGNGVKTRFTTTADLLLALAGRSICRTS